MKLKTLAVATASALALYGQALSVHAESNSAAGGTGGNATARLDFRVDIPSFLRIRVGTAGSGTMDTIQLSPTVSQLATSPSTVVSATAGSGDVGNGTVNVSVQGNPGGAATNLTYTTGAAALSDGTNTIPWTTVKVATAGGGGLLNHPATLADGFSGAAVSVIAGVSQTAGVINHSATWTYTFDDGGTVYPASAVGGYTGRVTYKLVTP